jgi:hypothetical protein
MEPKSVFASTTQWAAVIALIGAFLPAIGWSLGAGVDVDVTAAVGATVTAAGAVWVIVERWRRGDLFIRVPKP